MISATEVRLAFIDENDLSPKAEQRVIVQQAPRSKLVPILLVSLNVGVVALLLVFAAPKLGLHWGSDAPDPVTDTAQLDPALLVTPTGRRLDVKDFGGYLFEVTRITFSNDPAMRSVTITVPGNPPRQGVFRVRDSFAGGLIRVVEINASSVVLEHGGDQRTFMIEGGDPADVWERQPSGVQFIPARNSGAFPDAPAGKPQPPKDPVLEPEEPADTTTETGGVPEGLTLEELPDERYYALPQKEFQILVRTLPDIMENDFVFGKAIDPETRLAYAARVMNLRSDSVFHTHGMRAGDDIVSINDLDVRQPGDINTAARQVGSALELKIVIWRGDETIAFIFHAGPQD